MQEFHEGDLVEAVKGEQAIRGRVALSGGAMNIHVIGGSLAWGHDIRSLADAGFTLTLIEKAAPKLPTEPGYYRVGDNNAGVGGTLQLDTEGQWWWIGNEYRPNPEKIPAHTLSNYGNLTRLEPVPVTAKKVLDRIKGQAAMHGETLWGADAIAAHFGVTE